MFPRKITAEGSSPKKAGREAASASAALLLVVWLGLPGAEVLLLPLHFELVARRTDRLLHRKKAHKKKKT